LQVFIYAIFALGFAWRMSTLVGLGGIDISGRSSILDVGLILGKVGRVNGTVKTVKLFITS